MIRMINLDTFEQEQWNHKNEDKRKPFVWINGNTGFNATELIQWVNDNCKGRFFIPATMAANPKMFSHDILRIGTWRIWFEEKDDAVLFILTFGKGKSPFELS